ncbi:uncharacterized protein JCM6883_004515 [Sporobolomyces salmoneus]|uniref:uncharacterized protein n=1 Tax=Sporobolomyces salmoneus TaxID=183962 RepID=UPI00316F90AA
MTKGHSSHGSSGVHFGSGPHGTYQGKDANDVYHGARGTIMNPQTSPESKAEAHSLMIQFEHAAHDAYHGYRGTEHNPQASEQAKAEASSRMGNLPKW